MARLAALPGRPALLYLTMFEGPEGTTYTTSDIAGRLSAIAPVYSVYNTYLDPRIVCGHLDTSEAVGAAGAERSLRILAGEVAARIPPGPAAPPPSLVHSPAYLMLTIDTAGITV